MIKEVRNTLLELGVPREKVHHEFFAPGGGGAYRAKGTPSAVAAQARPDAASSAVGTEAVAILDGIRHRFTVPPVARSWTPRSRQASAYPTHAGAACAVPVAPEWWRARRRCSSLQPEPWEIERGFILSCQAVPKSERLVIDYDAM